MRKLKAPLLCLALGLLALPGCARRRPAVVEAEGRVLLNGQPLPNAQVEFMPELAHFGAEMNSSAVTDEQGRFRLTCQYKNSPGAAVATHRVLVTEAPVPDDMRAPAAQAQYGKYLAGLKNRPIPPAYGNVATTPLRVEVTAGKKEYEIALSR